MTNDDDDEHTSEWRLPRNIALIKGMLLRGDHNHHISALFGANPARIDEVKKGMPEFPAKPREPGKKPSPIIGADIVAAPPELLPPPGPYFLNFISERDIVEVGCEQATEQLALFIGMLEHAKPVDQMALKSARAARLAVHNALLERQREMYRGRQR